jgi:hypothetical protein
MKCLPCEVVRCHFRIAIAYCNLEFQAIQPGTPKTSYVFHMGEYPSEHLCSKLQ